ncbi:hypothetical protein GCM10023321_42650 [Pseudonocardia eucalypti]|uniref:Uncharacterized protein n=1 Tax=Pseudonocardia eucalypti TaxID=648755 RepID=A0ABP9QDX9_9PSEU|nr:hypothetical protein [Pseudonocardia eucalypti]
MKTGLLLLAAAAFSAPTADGAATRIAPGAPKDFPCGRFVEAGIPTQIGWSNCGYRPITLHIDYLVAPDRNTCLEPQQTQIYGSYIGGDFDYGGVNNIKDVTLVKEGC